MSTVGKTLCIVGAVGFVALGCGQSAEPLAERSSQLFGPTGSAFVIPAYIYHSFANDWSLIASSTERTWYVIAPSVAAEPGITDQEKQAWQNTIASLHDNYIAVLGYIAFPFGRPASEIETRISNWKAWYDVDGIYYDEAARDATIGQHGVGKHRHFAARARTVFTNTFSGTGTVIFGWGTVNPAMRPFVYCTWLDAGSSAIKVRFTNEEGNPAKYVNNKKYLEEASWVNRYNPSHFIGLVYGADGSQAQIDAILAESAHRNAQQIYISDGPAPPGNTWGRLAGAQVVGDEFGLFYRQYNTLDSTTRTFDGMSNDQPIVESCALDQDFETLNVND